MRNVRRLLAALSVYIASVLIAFALLEPQSLAQAPMQAPSSSHPPNAGSNSSPPQGEGSTDLLQEIVVTATRRGEQGLLSTAQAVDAYSGSTLQSYNIQSLQDLSKLDPSLNVQNIGATQQQVIIRGVSSSVGRTTGIYLDEAALQGGFNANNYGDGSPGLRLHDIDRVEVLKGPQGTLFGAGSMDGTLHVLTNKPKLAQVEALAEGTVAGVNRGDGYYDADAMLNIPIVTDRLGVRAVLWGENGGGYINQFIDGIQHKSVNDEHLYGGRAEILWKPTEALSLLGSVNYQNTKVDGSQSWTLFVGPVASPGAPAAPEQGPFAPYQNHSPSQEPYSSTYTLYTGTLQYNFNFGSIVATGTHGALNQLQPQDTSPTDCVFGFCLDSGHYPSVYSPHEQYADTTGEIRFSSTFNGPFQIVAGTYYEHDTFDYNDAVIVANAATGGAPCLTFPSCVATGLDVPGGGSILEFASADKVDTTQYALYSQVDYSIVRSLTATLGVRYFSADQHAVQITNQNVAPTTLPNGGFDGGFALGDITTPYVSATGRTHEVKTTYNASLLWAVNADFSVYGRAASGFRIGGLNTVAVLAAQQGVVLPSSFRSDILWNYEAGAKAYLLGRRLYLDLSLFQINWSNEQLNGLAGGTFNYSLNAGKTRTRGVELNAEYKPPIKGLTLAGGLTYVDAKLAADLPPDVVAAGTPGLSGDRIPRVPYVSFAGRAEYEWPIASAATSYLQTDFDYHGSSYTQFRSSTPTEIASGLNDYNTQLPAYFLLNLRWGARFGRYDLSIFCQNVTNETAYAASNAQLDAIRIFSARPRTIGVHLSAHF